MKDRVVTEGNSMQVMGEPGGLWVKDSVVTDLRAAGRTEMKCETLLVHISCLGICDVPFNLMYGL
jgi:hypothetical protein